jgi:hydroxymethylglutaryl-CoA reductase (NADPH)
VGKVYSSSLNLPQKVIEDVLRTSAGAKNLVGAAMVGTIGGQNMNAASVIMAIFIATGQVGDHLHEELN